MSRNELRKKLLYKRDQLSQIQRIEKSNRIQNNIFENEFIRKAKTVLCYVDFRSEVKTRMFIKKCIQDSKILTVPYTLIDKSNLLAVQIRNLENDLQSGYCSILEPIPDLIVNSYIDPHVIDVVIVPGSVFDSTGGRLGYGGGFYDRFLYQSCPKAVRIALAYELQMTEKVPMEEHDQFMDMIVTENKIYDCR